MKSSYEDKINAQYQAPVETHYQAAVQSHVAVAAHHQVPVPVAAYHQATAQSYAPVEAHYQTQVQSHSNAVAPHYIAPIVSHLQVPVEAHYQTSAEAHYQASVPSQSHSQAPIEAHYQVPAQSPNSAQIHFEVPAHTYNQRPSASVAETHKGIVDSIVNSGHFEPSSNDHEVVYKHVSVHEPKQEEEAHYQPIIKQQPAQNNKHYKIVFVKAPSAQSMAPIIRAPSVENEEKTFVYVLHMKPEQVPDVVLPEPEPTEVNHPEVYYINYEEKKMDAVKQETQSDEGVTIAPETPIHEEVDELEQQEEQDHKQQ